MTTPENVKEQLSSYNYEEMLRKRVEENRINFNNTKLLDLPWHVIHDFVELTLIISVRAAEKLNKR